MNEPIIQYESDFLAWNLPGSFQQAWSVYEDMQNSDVPVRVSGRLNYFNFSDRHKSLDVPIFFRRTALRCASCWRLSVAEPGPHDVDIPSTIFEVRKAPKRPEAQRALAVLDHSKVHNFCFEKWCADICACNMQHSDNSGPIDVWHYFSICVFRFL